MLLYFTPLYKNNQYQYTFFILEKSEKNHIESVKIKHSRHKITLITCFEKLVRVDFVHPDLDKFDLQYQKALLFPCLHGVSPSHNDIMAGDSVRLGQALAGNA